jgi:sarcosine oxidase subunit beta
MTGAASDVAVIGGGLIGLSVALAAARRGMTVTVLESGLIGTGASASSAGGVRSLNRHPAEIPLARAALRLWRELDASLGAPTGYAESGQIRVAEDDAAMAKLEARAALSRDLGYTHERLIDSAALAAREPALAGRAVGALIVEDDGFADQLASLRAYAAAARRAGVTVHQRRRVAAIARVGGALAIADHAGGETHARHVVNAAGVGGAALAEALGDRAPVRAAALQMSVTERVAPFVGAVIGSEGRKLSLKQTGDGTVVIGGAFEGVVGEDGKGRVWPKSLAANLANAARLFPALRGARVARSWAGVEAMVADGLPMLGPSGAAPGVVHAFGFSAHGFALSPLVGPLVADILEGRSSNLPLAPFAPDRFAD